MDKITAQGPVGAGAPSVSIRVGPRGVPPSHGDAPLMGWLRAVSPSTFRRGQLGLSQPLGRPCTQQDSGGRIGVMASRTPASVHMQGSPTSFTAACSGGTPSLHSYKETLTAGIRLGVTP